MHFRLQRKVDMRLLKNGYNQFEMHYAQCFIILICLAPDSTIIHQVRRAFSINKSMPKTFLLINQCRRVSFNRHIMHDALLHNGLLSIYIPVFINL